MQSTPVTPNTTEEYTMPCAEALLAGTLALMTGHVQACCGAHREAMVAKIVSNLTALTEDPMLSPGFKTLLWSLRSRWLDQSRGSPLAQLPSAERGLWHSSPEAVQ
ncbi:hypothetical protein [Rhodoferax saidenbachensis]|uniref:Uncharacterized protein n=1 Tax=Rhodoferax saidenbachensis TaxID=1484693 RepID=A0ABU1ZHL4_9BURK|nr:hypothetical protein [Rhodoferax saidenbachensis]MDR7305025.1 hypothetical protein [Rhodoferax saidenbachensis]